ncbi:MULTISPECIES: TadE/TadG family type IV pilus assembly protein [Streptomycetaceae]|uniref:TadE-like domain-containing protein n=1 Tax=Streptantibioticus cattleyicolor (strain ATCC 35852 / DSM 46488 / JCM 4925 / NBRC 14057 / NRRL 8057) TaxID=1003195 RepID=F8K2E3_STREN|nr:MULTISPECIES: TadE/TadG family type IV pilus assembly protein [Streptomycetaceae]AEW96235.1 hypothetical protein SCATT_38640 [Streptantibioticus cattleyicolor NRRL 8057 = DSM 46488]MYS60755.1 pilus assembly protein [Streptomyces sp. SID5468]CCB76574.1 putative septum site-determining protein [Streptantibioticus cattleyicolor NRRL 8057 = DSM 46488]
MTGEDRTAPRTTARRTPRDSGQISVELLGIAPLILLVLLLVWQFVLVGYTWTLAGEAADRAARVAAVGGDAEGAAREALPGAWARGARVGVGGDGELVRADVAVPVPVLLPGLGALFTVHGTAGAARERP